MYYFILIIFTVLSLLAGYKQNRLFLSITQGESFISPEKLGTVRSYIYAFSIIISFIIDIVNYISGWAEYRSSIENPFMPLSFLYGEAYGASAALQVFFILLVEIVFVCSVCFLRGLSLKMIIHYIMDGNCTKYKYIKKITRVLVLAFIMSTLFSFVTVIESDLVSRLTGESYDINFQSNFVYYNLTWIIAFLTLSNSYKNKIKLSSPQKSSAKNTHKSKFQLYEETFCKAYNKLIKLTDPAPAPWVISSFLLSILEFNFITIKYPAADTASTYQYLREVAIDMQFLKSPDFHKRNTKLYSDARKIFSNSIESHTQAYSDIYFKGKNISVNNAINDGYVYSSSIEPIVNVVSDSFVFAFVLQYINDSHASIKLQNKDNRTIPFLDVEKLLDIIGEYVKEINDIAALFQESQAKQKIESSPEKQTEIQDQQTKKQEKAEYNPVKEITHECINIYNNSFNALNESLKKFASTEKQRFEIRIFLLLIIDFAASKSPQRKEIFDQIWFSTTYSPDNIYKYEPTDAEEKAINSRLDLYGRIIRGECQIRGEYLMSGPPETLNWLQRVCLALGDIIYNPSCADNYENAPICIKDIMTGVEFSEVIMKSVFTVAVQTTESISRLLSDANKVKTSADSINDSTHQIHSNQAPLADSEEQIIMNLEKMFAIYDKYRRLFISLVNISGTHSYVDSFLSNALGAFFIDIDCPDEFAHKLLNATIDHILTKYSGDCENYNEIIAEHLHEYSKYTNNIESLDYTEMLNSHFADELFVKNIVPVASQLCSASCYIAFVWEWFRLAKTQKSAKNSYAQKAPSDGYELMKNYIKDLGDVYKSFVSLNKNPNPSANNTNDSDTSPSPDEARLAEIEAELKKIPVAKVKQWYADGKLSDEQYKAIAQKYNILKKERDDIKERLELLKNI